jgi:MFS family permease
MALSASSNSPLAVLLGGAMFGGTFMGIVALAMEAGRDLAPGAPGRIVGTLTAVYGVGQIVGPLAAGAISERLGDPRPAVLMAAAAVALGGALLGLPSHPPVREAGLEAPPEEEDACRT